MTSSDKKGNSTKKNPKNDSPKATGNTPTPIPTAITCGLKKGKKS